MLQNPKNTICITGGAGFIGCNLIHLLIKEFSVKIINIDKLTYAGNLESLQDIQDNERYIFEKVDICDNVQISKILEKYKPIAFLNLAAESHVDRSIDSPDEFIKTNILGTYNLLECIRNYYKNLNDTQKSEFRFLHVSTDEVFGSLGKNDYFTEKTAYQPNSPYSASKASSDHLVRAWQHTYGIPTLITNCSNNYGPYQFPEKLIPLNIYNALQNKPITIYGNGSNVRDWIFVEDHCRGILEVLVNGSVGESYNIGSNNEKNNLELIELICKLLDEIQPRPDSKSYKEQITFINDRLGHDQRYAIDASKMKNNLKWESKESLESGLRKTIDWYLNNSSWLKSIMSVEYQGQRLGISV